MTRIEICCCFLLLFQGGKRVLFLCRDARMGAKGGVTCDALQKVNSNFLDEMEDGEQSATGSPCVGQRLRFNCLFAVCGSRAPLRIRSNHICTQRHIKYGNRSRGMTDFRDLRLKRCVWDHRNALPPSVPALIQKLE